MECQADQQRQLYTPCNIDVPCTSPLYVVRIICQPSNSSSELTGSATRQRKTSILLCQRRSRVFMRKELESFPDGPGLL